MPAIKFVISALLLLFGGRWIRYRRRRGDGRRRSRRGGDRRVRSGLLAQAFLEIPDAFAESAHNFRDSAAAKKQHNDDQHYQPMEWAKFTHKDLPFASQARGK